MGIRASKYGCIISFLYIKPQLPTQHVILGWVVLYRFSTSNHNYACSCPCGIALYYIVSLHQTTTARVARTPSICCIISFLYIKPQPQSIAIALLISCIISFLYIKPQRYSLTIMLLFGCIISFLYIKPQLQQRTPLKLIVVLYRFSTSNHNFIRLFASNDLLYYIVSLHQTTTESVELYTRDGLYYIVSLHQTTTRKCGIIHA